MQAQNRHNAGQHSKQGAAMAMPMSRRAAWGPSEGLLAAVGEKPAADPLLLRQVCQPQWRVGAI